MLRLGLSVLLAPLLIWQGRDVRRRALRLPEALGPRQGSAGQGGLGLRVLIVGDSSGAGVGAGTQEEALAGRLAQALAQRLGARVQWQLLARTGHTTAQALDHLAQAPEVLPADVLVTALGVNDVSAGLSAGRWLDQLAQLHRLALARAGVRYTLHSAVPPMHDFPLLPQPLRWWMGDRAASLNQALAQQLQACGDRGMESFALPRQGGHALPDLMAADGFHPGPAGYALWAEALAERLAREWQAVGRRL